MKKLIPAIAINELILTKNPVITVEKEKVDGNVTLKELDIINKLIKYYNPKTIFEIGTFDGRTTLNMALNSNAKTKLFTLDLPETEIGKTKFKLYTGSKFSDINYVNKNESGKRFKGTEADKKITQLFGDSATFKFSPYYKKIDFIFIDGSHAKKYTQNDTEKAIKLCRSTKSIILWHDYGVWDGVTEALNELYTNDKRFKNLKHILGTCLVIRD